MLPRLAEKVLLITGGTGMAAATARIAAAEGASVFMAGLEAEKDLPFDFCKADLSVSKETELVVKMCVSKFGRIDGVFNVAGISGRRYGDGPAHECTDEGWDMTMHANARSTFLVCRTVLQYWLKKKAHGSIVNMATVTALSPEPKHFATHAYAASKAAIIGLTVSMASYYAPKGIRVNAVAPGLVKTPMSKRAQSNAEIMAYIQAKQPVIGGILEADDIAKAAIYLLSDESRGVTGQVLHVDGGWQVTSI